MDKTFVSILLYLFLVTYKPSGIDSSTVPSWVKLPVETHEPNTSGTPPKESSTDVYSSTLTMNKPTTFPSISDNDIIMTSNSINTNNISTQYPSSSSTLSMLTQLMSTTTESADAGNAPLNMTNYKDGKYRSNISHINL